MIPTSPNSRNPQDLDPVLRKGMEEGFAEWKRDYPNAPQPFFVQTYRSPLLQAAYYAQGREPLAEVNRLRANIKIPPLTAKENQLKVTNARPGMSKHQDNPARAADIAFTDVPGDEFNTIYPEPLFKKFAAIVKKKGINWGGDFKRFKDYPHFELPD